MRSKLYLFLALALGLFVSCEDKSPKPNLVFILTDQQSFDMLGCYGNTQIITPQIDAFASEALQFSNCFSNSPVCTPYRGMLMSGQHPLYNGCFNNDLPLIPGNGKKIGEALRDAGFNTAYIGKWHLLGGDRNRPVPSGPLRYGFDEVFYTNNCHVDFRPGKSYYWNTENQKIFFDEWEVYGKTHQALDYLESRKKQNSPFALFLSWHPPHDWGKFEGEDGSRHYLYDAPEELMALYNRDSIQVRPGMQNSPDLQRMYHGHMAMISGIDGAFGQIMDKLKALGFDKNTVVVFTSDHGDMLEFSNAQKPKQYPHDYSTHVPFLLKYPGMENAGKKTQLMLGALDIMPTILGLLKLKVPKEAHGRDLSKAIRNNDENAVVSIPLFLYTPMGFHGIVTKEYTYAFQSTDSLGQANVLFDRIKDPYQLNNKFNDPDYSIVKAQLHAKAVQWMEYYEDGGFTSADLEEIMSTDEWVKQGRESDVLHRPIYMLKKLHGDRIMYFHGNNNYD